MYNLRYNCQKRKKKRNEEEKLTIYEMAMCKRTDIGAGNEQQRREHKKRD